MSLTSFSFFAFLLITVCIYYLCPKVQKYVLLVASIFFYISVSPMEETQLILLIIYIMAITYIGGILIEKNKGVIKSVTLVLCVAGLVSLLFVTKYAYNLFSIFVRLFDLTTDLSWLQFGSIIGISYFILSAIGYLVDVYWGMYNAEKNIAVVTVFTFYFPQVISGPVTRFSEMRDQFKKIHRFEASNIENGIRRMLWGYFQKLVISERFAIIVQTVYGDYKSYSGIGIAAATLCYAVQLYTDFSGCMDIIMGASEIFAISLPENFKAPFYSKTVQEFWQRWHVSLGTWFKDYVMYPLQKSSLLVKIGKYCKKRIGKKVGKKVPFYISMTVLWFLLGVWHGGTGYYFFASAIIPFILLMGSDSLQSMFAKWTKLFRINNSCTSWRIFQSIRTVLLICICWIFVCAGSTMETFDIVKHMISNPIANTTLEEAFIVFGLDVKDVLIMITSLIVLLCVDKKKYEGICIHKFMDEQNFIFKWFVIYVEILVILLYGMVGTSSFIYFQF
ncbi:MAG: MBOAT family protein [Agathobacter sp.]|nr:MBOAT family protein [Agathobacter sp.]